MKTGTPRPSAQQSNPEGNVGESLLRRRPNSRLNISSRSLENRFYTAWTPNGHSGNRLLRDQERRLPVFRATTRGTILTRFPVTCAYGLPTKHGSSRRRDISCGAHPYKIAMRCFDQLWNRQRSLLVLSLLASDTWKPGISTN